MKRLTKWIRFRYKMWKLRREDPYIYEEQGIYKLEQTHRAYATRFSTGIPVSDEGTNEIRGKEEVEGRYKGKMEPCLCILWRTS